MFNSMIIYPVYSFKGVVMSKSLLMNLSSSKNGFSYAYKFRRKRMLLFEKLFPELKNKEIKVLDLGGRSYFWTLLGYNEKENLSITILNLNLDNNVQAYKNITSVVGDACNLKNYKSKSFEIIFSNSVIEHVGSFHNQTKMAGEIKRVGINHFIQTPNYWFPFEPHFLFFGFQYLPRILQTFLISHYNMGWFERQKDKSNANQTIDSVNMLSKRKLINLFPESTIINEYFLGFVKSFIITNRSLKRNNTSYNSELNNKNQKN